MGLVLLRGDGDGSLGGLGDSDLLGTQMIEVDVEDSGAAAVPHVFRDGELEDDHALAGLAGVDHGFAEEGLGGDGFENRKGRVDVVEITLFDGAGCNLFSLRGGEGGGEVFEEERKVGLIVDVKGGKDVQMIFDVLVGDDDGVGFEGGACRDDDGFDDRQLGGSVGIEADNQRKGNAKNKKGQKNRHKEIAPGGLGELKIRHWQ